MNQSDISLRQVTQLIGRLLTGIAVLPAPWQYRPLQGQQILEFAESREAKFRYTGSVIRRSEKGNSVVDRKPDVVQRHNINFPLTDHNFKCLSSGLGQPVRGRGKPCKYT